jgi:serine/threonine protein kinase
VKALSAYDHEGGYGRVRKVRIKGMDKIPDYIYFAGKTSKAKTPLDSRVQWSTEALACPLNHLSIIKFWMVHATTMEVYTLWWNGDSLRKMAMLNLKVSPTTPMKRIKEIPSLQEEQARRITLYRRHRRKLAWTLVYIANLMHKSSVLHNVLSPHNILLHFPELKKNKICIGICDWGIASRVHERAPSHYGFPSIREKKHEMKKQWWVALEMFYAFEPSRSETCIENMQAIHKYSVETDLYSIGKLALMMFAEEVDLVYFC